MKAIECIIEFCNDNDIPYYMSVSEQNSPDGHFEWQTLHVTELKSKSDDGKERKP